MRKCDLVRQCIDNVLHTKYTFVRRIYNEKININKYKSKRR